MKPYSHGFRIMFLHVAVSYVGSFHLSILSLDRNLGRSLVIIIEEGASKYWKAPELCPGQSFLPYLFTICALSIPPLWLILLNMCPQPWHEDHIHIYKIVYLTSTFRCKKNNNPEILIPLSFWPPQTELLWDIWALSPQIQVLIANPTHSDDLKSLLLVFFVCILGLYNSLSAQRGQIRSWYSPPELFNTCHIVFRIILKSLLCSLTAHSFLLLNLISYHSITFTTFKSPRSSLCILTE